MVGLDYGFGLFLLLFLGYGRSSGQNGGEDQEDANQGCVINFGHLIFEFIIGLIILWR